MRPIQLIILVVALGAAVAAAMLAMNLTGKSAGPKVATDTVVPAEEVLILARDVKMGETVKTEDLAWKDWPKAGLADSYIVRSRRAGAEGEIAGMIAKTQLYAGEPVREAKLVKADRGFLSAVLPKGQRAVAVRVNAASTAGGFILPNDHVDVILTTQQGGGDAGAASAVSETLLHNIRVLAIDQKVDDPEEKKSVVAQDTATLALTPEQAHLVIQAQQMGSISLILRSIADSDPGADDTTPRTGVSVVKFGVSSRVTAPTQ
jgi:Flp pilus assembly protein CpaB